MYTKQAGRSSCDPLRRARFLGLLPRSAARVQILADRAFAQLKADPQYPSLHFKKAGTFWSARVGVHWRALPVAVQDGLLWFWIGTHSDYDRIVG